MSAHAACGRLICAHDAGHDAPAWVNADLGYESCLDQALRCPAERLVEGGTQIG